jgi:hypothetical protein
MEDVPRIYRLQIREYCGRCQLSGLAALRRQLPRDSGSNLPSNFHNHRVRRLSMQRRQWQGEADEANASWHRARPLFTAGHIHGRRASLSLLNVASNPLAFSECHKAAHVDPKVMYEQVRPPYCSIKPQPVFLSNQLTIVICLTAWNTFNLDGICNINR